MGFNERIMFYQFDPLFMHVISIVSIEPPAASNGTLKTLLVKAQEAARKARFLFLSPGRRIRAYHYAHCA